MKNYSIANNFDRYFLIQLANTRALKEEVFKIRYGVYSYELGWETGNQQQMETDIFDNYAYHCLIKHRRTGTYAGCIRLIVPPANRSDFLLPCENHCLHYAWPEVIDSTELPRGSFGEISRLAVLSSFRRRLRERRKPFVINSFESNTIFTEDEHRNFPNIAIGLYLASLSLADICDHQGTFVMMEPRLNRCLSRIGLQFQQASDLIEHHGKRAMFHLARENFKSNLKPELQELYELIHAELLAQQFVLPLKNASA
ncbi:PEP-CTERM/exosortase system-associated acyltransferase [Colwellia chukchiensis]|nr:PEP-CTERM/exosortase system-associated acyltransferase [Colwellia chukchiensis]